MCTHIWRFFKKNSLNLLNSYVKIKKSKIAQNYLIKIEKNNKQQVGCFFIFILILAYKITIRKTLTYT